MAANDRKQKFIDMLLPAALAVSAETGVDPRIIIAQAALETGWGAHAPGNNFFGIKSHGKGGGQTLTTQEVVNGKRVTVKDSFRRYDSPAASVFGYGEFITRNPRYRALRQAKGLDAQLAALQASGYATHPEYSHRVGLIARNLPLTPQSVTEGPLRPATELRGTISPFRTPAPQRTPAAAPVRIAEAPPRPMVANVTPPPPGPVVALAPNTFLQEQNVLRPVFVPAQNALAR